MRYCCPYCGFDLSEYKSVIRMYWWHGNDGSGDEISYRGHYDSFGYFDPDETHHLPSGSQYFDNSDRCLCCGCIVTPESSKEAVEISVMSVDDLPLHINREWCLPVLKKAYMIRVHELGL